MVIKCFIVAVDGNTSKHRRFGPRSLVCMTIWNISYYASLSAPDTLKFTAFRLGMAQVCYLLLETFPLNEPSIAKGSNGNYFVCIFA